MDSIDEQVRQHQIKIEAENLRKAQERKEKALLKKSLKRKRTEDANENEETHNSKKKKEKTSYIPLTKSDLDLLKFYFWTEPQIIPSLNKVGLFSGVTGELMFFAAYPILIAPYDRKKPVSEYILGVSKPQVIFSILRMIFKKAHPECEVTEFQFWDPYKWNKAYYGSKTEAQSHKISYPVSLGSSRPFGGTEHFQTVNWVEESKLKRYQKSISIPKYLKKRNPMKEKSKFLIDMKLPVDVSCYPDDYLENLSCQVAKFRMQQEEADRLANEKMTQSEVVEAMKEIENNNHQDFSDDSEDE